MSRFEKRLQARFRVTKTPVPFRPQVVVDTTCEGWAIPDSWWFRVAQPGLEELLQLGAKNPEEIAYALLQDEVGKCPLPPSTSVQVDNPAGDDYWAGPPELLYLVQHVQEEVEHALEATPPRFKILSVYGGPL